MIQRSMTLELSMVAHACDPSMKEGVGSLGPAWAAEMTLCSETEMEEKIFGFIVSRKRKRREVSPDMMALTFPIPVPRRLRHEQCRAFEAS